MKTAPRLACLVFLAVTRVAFADQSQTPDDSVKIGGGAAGIVSRDLVGQSTLAGGEATFSLKLPPIDSVFGTKIHMDANASLGGAADPTGKQGAAVTGGAEFNLAIDGYKDAKPGDFQMQGRVNVELLKGNPLTASQGVWFGPQFDWGSGRIALLLPLFAAQYDRVNDTVGLGAIGGAKILAEQDLGTILKLKAALEGMAFLGGGGNGGAMVGDGEQGSASVGLELKAGQHVVLGANFAAEDMIANISAQKPDGSYTAPVEKTVAPLTGTATAALVF